MKSPWNPPEHAQTFTLRRKTADGWEQCTTEDPNTRQVDTRQPCGIARSMFLALWGGGSFECTFHKADGTAAGRAAFTLNVEPRPAHATKDTCGAPEPDAANDDDDQDDGDDGNEAAPAAPAAATPAASPELGAVVEALRREMAELRAENRRLKGFSNLVPRREPPPPPVVPTLGALPGITPEAAATLSLFMNLQEIAQRNARYEIERIQAVEDARTTRDDARHRRELEEQEARHQRSLELLQALANERAKPRDALVTELRSQLRDLQEAAPPETQQAGPLEVAAAQAVPVAASALAEIAKHILMKNTSAAVAALPAAVAAE